MSNHTVILENTNRKIKLGETIGEGGTATVFLAADMEDESKKYAVKRLTKQEMDAWDIADYKREVFILKKLSGHPNIVQYIDCFENDLYYYLVLEYCETDLFDSIFLNCGFPSNVVKKFFSEITNGLDHCHRNEIFHRDIKPENILIADNGSVAKLTDFGLATFDKYTDEFGIGSDRYMAPECLCLDDDQHDSGFSEGIDCYSSPAADIWALGVLLINMLFGRNPWHKAAFTDIIFGAYIGSDPDVLKRNLKLTTEFDQFLRGNVFNLDPDKRCSVSEFNAFVQAQARFADNDEVVSHGIECIADGNTIQIFHQIKPSNDDDEDGDRSTTLVSQDKISQSLVSSLGESSAGSLSHIGSIDIGKLTFSSANLDNPYVESPEGRIRLIKKLGLGSSSGMDNTGSLSINRSTLSIERNRSRTFR